MNFTVDEEEKDDNNKTEQKNHQLKKIKEITVNKYSQNRKGDLHESILIDNDPLFLNIDIINGNNNADDDIKLSPSIVENSRILCPPSLEEYLHNPYEFSSIEEIKSFMERAKTETIFTLFKKAKSIVSQYVDQDEHIINLNTIDILFSYFQDRFNTTHYTGIFGDNGSGKSSIGDVVEALSYRAVNTTDPTPANIFRSLGSIEAGQITLILDEAEKIDQSPEMMSILKTGYDFRKQVSRINQNSGKPEKFYTYCSKYIIGERPPSQTIAKGVLDRTFSLVVYFGKPAYDIKEILNPTETGGEEFEKLYKEIIEFRKLLFIYRLMHFKDAIPNIDIGISGRNKELVKPYLQLFSNLKTEEETKVYKEIEKTFQTLLKIKNNKKDFTIEAVLIPLIIDLIEKSKTKTISFSDFWTELKDKINGYFDEKKPNEYHTEDYGTIYRNSISNVLQKLGVDSKRHNIFTELIFNRRKIMKNASQYNISIQTKLEAEDSECCERCEHPIEEGTNTSQMLKEDIRNNAPISINKQEKNNENNHYNNGNSELENISNDENQLEPSDEHTQRSRGHSSTSNNFIEAENKKNIYRIGNSDTWSCKECKIKGDKWFMKQHQCKGVMKNYEKQSIRKQ
jgi:hypothetical protein